MKDAQTLITEKQQEVKKKYDAALAAAKKDGDKYDVVGPRLIKMLTENLSQKKENLQHWLV